MNPARIEKIQDNILVGLVFFILVAVANATVLFFTIQDRQRPAPSEEVTELIRGFDKVVQFRIGEIEKRVNEPKKVIPEHKKYK